jgi:hypothetical protein
MMALPSAGLTTLHPEPATKQTEEERGKRGRRGAHREADGADD